jgi:hypothetical protein
MVESEWAFVVSDQVLFEIGYFSVFTDRLIAAVVRYPQALGCNLIVV